MCGNCRSVSVSSRCGVRWQCSVARHYIVYLCVWYVQPCFRIVEVSKDGGGTIFTLHSPTHSLRSWPVQSHCPLKIGTSRSRNVAGAALLKPFLLSPLGLTPFFIIIIILTFWHLRGKFCNVFQRETAERGELSNSVSMPTLMSQQQNTSDRQRQAAQRLDTTTHMAVASLLTWESIRKRRRREKEEDNFFEVLQKSHLS